MTAILILQWSPLDCSPPQQVSPILTLPCLFPLVQNNSTTPLLVLFSNKSQSLVFPSGSAPNHPGIWGLTVYSDTVFMGKPRSQLREGGWSVWAHGLLTVPSCRKIPRVSSVNKRALGSPVQVRCPLASCQPPLGSSPHKLQASFPFSEKASFCFFPLLGSRVAGLQSIFCAFPEQVWIKVAVSHSSTCPDLYNPSEVFAEKENLREQTSAVSSLLCCASASGLAFSHGLQIKGVCTHPHVL